MGGGEGRCVSEANVLWVVVGVTATTESYRRAVGGGVKGNGTGAASARPLTAVAVVSAGTG